MKMKILFFISLLFVLFSCTQLDDMPSNLLLITDEPDTVKYQFSYRIEGNGKIESSVDTGEIPESSEVFLEFVPNDTDHQVDSVVINGENRGSIDSCTIKIDTIYNVVAHFGEMHTDSVKITVEYDTMAGSITPSGTFQIVKGGDQTFVLSVKDSFQFDSVLVNGEKDTNFTPAENEFTSNNIDQDITVRIFSSRIDTDDTAKTFTITPFITGTGTGSSDPDSAAIVQEGDSVKFTFTAGLNSVIDSIYCIDTIIYVDGKEEHSVTYRNVQKDDTIKAYFNLIRDTLVRKAGMVLIPAKDSTFIMGSAEVKSSQEREFKHPVTLSHDFWMDTTEVTQKMYFEMMSEIYQTDFDTTVTDKWNKGIGDNYPAYQLNWYDAILYCNARSELEGKEKVYTFASMNKENHYFKLDSVKADFTKNGYRLPTEAEWEYSCRAGDTTSYYWRNADANLFAWYDNPTSTTQPVGGKSPNRFGLYDMSGNVWEWCHDIYIQDYEELPDTDPTGPTNANWNSDRIVRGGAWNSGIEEISAHKRESYVITTANNYCGFRTVLPVKE